MEARACLLDEDARSRIVAYLCRVGATPEDAEDALQDALLALLRRPERAGSIACVESWLCPVARRRLVDRWRHTGRTRSGLDPECCFATDADCEAELDAFSTSCTALPASHQLILGLLVQGCDAEAISARLVISRWAAYKRIERARKAVSVRMEQSDTDPGGPGRRAHRAGGSLQESPALPPRWVRCRAFGPGKERAHDQRAQSKRRSRRADRRCGSQAPRRA